MSNGIRINTVFFQTRRAVCAYLCQGSRPPASKASQNSSTVIMDAWGSEGPNHSRSEGLRRGSLDWSMVCFFLGSILNLLLICELGICRYN